MITKRKSQLWNVFKPRRERVSERYPCRVPGVMMIALRDVEIPGVMLDVGAFGCRFRPALSYLVVRNGENIVLEIAGRSLTGQIVQTSPLGYGVRFDDEHDISDFI